MAWLQPIASLKIVTDDLRCRPSTLESSTVRGGGLSGKFICFSPFETEVYLDWTNLRGSGPNIWLSFIYRMHKWDYRIAKLDEYIEVTPTFEYYKLTIEEKHKIEQTIKQGLASASQAVADYDMMAHDVRRYQEILDYFEKAHRTKDDHILRSLFVDRVDAYTGEGYSLVSMAKRWPTIITDFIRMKSEWTEKEDSQEEQVKRIRAGLDVSMAEATVLRSKDILFREWKKLFLPVVQDRYARVKVIADARKESINEYKEWLKPYIARFRMMRETLEKDPTAHLNDPFLTPGLGIAATNQGARIWIWKPFHPQEFRKSEMIREHKGFVVYPFDDFAKEWMEKINKWYKLDGESALTEEYVKEKLHGIAEQPFRYPATPESDLDPASMYYVFFDIEFFMGVHKTPPPKGAEMDNPQFKVTGWIMSANVLLVHLMEQWAREKELTKYINVMIGSKEMEDEIKKHVEEMFKVEEKKFKGIKNVKEKLSHAKGKLAPAGKAGRKVKKGLERFAHLYVKPGPYDSVFSERISKTMAKELREEYQRLINFLLWKMGIDYQLELYGTVAKN